MSVEEKITKELKGRKRGGGKSVAPSLSRGEEQMSAPAPTGLASLVQAEVFHLQSRSDLWTLWTIGLIALITMLAFLGLWPKGEEGWLARIVWKAILAGAIGAVALLFSRTQERIQKRMESLSEIANDIMSGLGGKYRSLGINQEQLESDATTKLLFVKAAAVVAAISILFII